MVDLEQFEAGGGVDIHIALFERKAPGLEKNSHDFAGEAAGLGEEQNSRSHRIFILRVHVFDLTGNFRGLLQHGGD